ncbi:MAG TPA: COQ9 family protein [Caulobacteraceae bacterium]
MSQETDWATAAEESLLAAALARAPRLGWTRRLVAEAARATGLTEGEAELLLPHGARDLAALLARSHDARALQALCAHDPAGMKIRDRIRLAVIARCEAAMRDEAAVRRWSGFLALPSHVPLALRLLWASADNLWRWAGDTSTDENHYSKRVILAEILASTLAVWLASGEAVARTHLDGRIDAVMAFEMWKARAIRPRLGVRLAQRLGRMRYGGGPAPAKERHS